MMSLRNFDYRLNEKSAKAKLVKAAKRDALEVQENSGSSNLIFSPGSWQVAVLPSVSYWKQVKSEQSCKVGETVIRVGGVKAGKDSSGKIVVNQIVFLADRHKIVCHLYNTTQLILVNGNGYQHFFEVCLKPFFQAKIDASLLRSKL